MSKRPMTPQKVVKRTIRQAKVHAYGPNHDAEDNDAELGDAGHDKVAIFKTTMEKSTAPPDESRSQQMVRAPLRLTLVSPQHIF